MKYLVARDKKNRYMYQLLEKKRILFKSILLNKFLACEKRSQVQKYLHVKKGYQSLIRNYCEITTRSRGVVSKYALSRMIFKQYISFGYLKGIKKASW